MKTLAELKQILFYKLSVAEKKQLIAAATSESKQSVGREASIQAMAAKVMRKAV